MKGIELPINVLIIVSVAVIVLIAIVAMFYPAFAGGSVTLSSESAKSSACQILVEAKKCATTTNSITMGNFDADKDGYTGIGPPNDATTAWDTTWSTFPTCTPSDNQASYGDNLASLCYCYYSIRTEARCKSLCGC